MTIVIGRKAKIQTIDGIIDSIVICSDSRASFDGNLSWIKGVVQKVFPIGDFLISGAGYYQTVSYAARAAREVPVGQETYLFDFAREVMNKISLMPRIPGDNTTILFTGINRNSSLEMLPVDVDNVDSTLYYYNNFATGDLRGFPTDYFQSIDTSVPISPVEVMLQLYTLAMMACERSPMIDRNLQWAIHKRVGDKIVSYMILPDTYDGGVNGFYGRFQGNIKDPLDMKIWDRFYTVLHKQLEATRGGSAYGLLSSSATAFFGLDAVEIQRIATESIYI